MLPSRQYSALIAPRIIGKAIDSVAEEQRINLDALGKLHRHPPPTLFILLHTKSLCSLLANKVANFTARDIRKDAFEKHNLPVKYFDTHKHGDIISILSVDIENMTEGLLAFNANAYRHITVIGTLVF